MTVPAPIGGSEAAAACGIDPFCSRVELWARKTGRMPEREQTEPMRWGKLLEPIIVDTLCSDGLGPLYAAEEARDPERPWLIGHADRLRGDDGVLEVKTASWRQSWKAVPLHIQLQGQQYLHLYDRKRVTFACLVGGQHLVVHEVERDQRAIDLMLDLEHTFWLHVVNDEAPAPDSSKSAQEALGHLYPEQVRGMVHRCDDALYEVWKRYTRRRAQRIAVQKQEDADEALLKAAMRDAETLLSPKGDALAHWHTSTTRRLDVTTVRQKASHIYETYAKETTTRRFTVA